MSSTRSARGRPPTPGPPTTPATPSAECDAVIAWLLRVNRIYGPRGDFAVASRFAPMLLGDGISGTESQISRWERGTSRVPHPVIQRYERLLGITDGRITAIADTLYRERLGRLGPPTLHRPHPSGDTYDLLDRALGHQTMTGHDWDRLTGNLLGPPQIMLYPRSLWDRLAQRLMAELLIAEGPGWLHRCEAMNRLLGHHDATTAVIDACAAAVSDRHSQILIEPMALLELTPHPDAAHHLLRHITDPASGHALRAAWWAVAEKTGRGHFSAAQLSIVTSEAIAALRDQSAPHALRVAAAETLRQASPFLAGARRGDIRHLARLDPTVRHVVEQGMTSSTEVIAATATRIVDGTLSRMPRDVLRDDPTLHRLIAEMVYHPQGTRRVIAAQAIAATPYRGAAAQTIAVELQRNGTMTDVPRATALVQALTHLGGPGERTLLERLVLGQGVPLPIRDAASWMVGHVPDHDGTAFWASATRRLAQSGAGPRTMSEASARGLVYSLGIAGRRTELAQLAAADDLRSDLRAAANWWLRIPETVRYSARA